jgi:hypothetical protein
MKDFKGGLLTLGFVGLRQTSSLLQGLTSQKETLSWLTYNNIINTRVYIGLELFSVLNHFREQQISYF